MEKRQLLGVVRGRKVFRGDAADAGVAFHGGVVRLQVPYTEITETKAAHAVERVLQAIESGLAQIEGQTNPYLTGALCRLERRIRVKRCWKCAIKALKTGLLKG